MNMHEFLVCEPIEIQDSDDDTYISHNQNKIYNS